MQNVPIFSDGFPEFRSVAIDWIGVGSRCELTSRGTFLILSEPSIVEIRYHEWETEPIRRFTMWVLAEGTGTVERWESVDGWMLRWL